MSCTRTSPPVRARGAIPRADRACCVKAWGIVAARPVHRCASTGRLVRPHRFIAVRRPGALCEHTGSLLCVDRAPCATTQVHRCASTGRLVRPDGASWWPGRSIAVRRPGVLCDQMGPGRGQTGPSLCVDRAPCATTQVHRCASTGRLVRPHRFIAVRRPGDSVVTWGLPVRTQARRCGRMGQVRRARRRTRGDMGGAIDNGAFPMEMMVDYVRVCAF